MARNDTSRAATSNRVAFVLRGLLYLVTIRLLVDLFVLSCTRVGHWWHGFDEFKLSWISLTLALLGASIIAWTGARTRRTTSAGCPRCRYDLTGLPSTICPECGTDYIVLRAQLLGAHTRRRRILACASFLLLVLSMAGATRLHMYYLPRTWSLYASVPDESPTQAAARIADVRSGMPLAEVEAMLEPHSGRTGTCSAPGCTAFGSQALYYGPWPTHYRIGIVLPVYPASYYSIWDSGPVVHFDADERVTDIATMPWIESGAIRIW